jgi:hypothetical protein
MGPKRKRPPSGVLNFSTGRTDQIAHDLVLADLRLWVDSVEEVREPNEAGLAFKGYQPF